METTQAPSSVVNDQQLESTPMPTSPNSLKSMENFENGAGESHHLVLIGGGPRSVIQVNTEIIFMILFRDHFRELCNLGAHYDISTTVIEKKEGVGLGSPYCAGQTGMMNTGLEDDIHFPLSLPKGSEALSVLMHFLSYKQRYESFVGQNTDAYYEEVKKYNLPGSIMFKKSVGPESFSLDGTLDHKIAYIMRRTTGAEEEKTFEVVRSLAQRLLPFYKLNIQSSSEVRGVKVQSTGKQLVISEQRGTSIPQTIEADQVRLNTGTILKNPVLDARVRDLMFCQAMNVEHFKLYCAERQLLDNDGWMKQGIKVISGGMGLSGLDQLTVLDGVMNLFEEDESHLLGYKVKESAKLKYQNAITLISRTEGRSVFPRQGFTPEWRQDGQIMAFTEHLHALSLHNQGEEVFGIWYDILTASVARTMKKTPEEVRQGNLPIETSLKLQYEETLKFLHNRRLAGDQEKEGNLPGKERFMNEAMKTVYGAWRQATTAFLLGYGLESSIQAATDRMENLAPITWKGRQSWLFTRTMVGAITDPEFALKKSNMEYFHNWKNIYRYIASSPVEIHSMMHLLIEAGIASYEHAEYNQVIYDDATGKLDVNGILHDLFIVSPTYETSEDVVSTNISQQLQPFVSDHPSYGKIGKFRKFQDKLGRSVPIECNGVAGLGFDVHEHGMHSKVGTFAVDLNDRSSGTGVASSFTLRRMAVAHMKAAGIECAEEKIEELYELGKPSIEAYENEVRKFEKYFLEAYEIWAYLRAIEAIAGDDGRLFCELYDSGLTRNGREAVMEKCRSESSTGVNGSEIYFRELANVPAFNILSRDGFYARSVDTTDEEDVWLYKEAFKLAKKHLKVSSN
ncbi:unnamed protein product [Agarophyton chilense]|eukprot:gb/GEZJ01003875.1/.p1 GENE.gb/GEZJ01003875.1/~~gb/GEZJ01003875.1/.p1  ORF type:complete len:851 (-),score=129.30 gb/GEZJ01003875.1/:949-3501(-)